jgi:hypothetical protein
MRIMGIMELIEEFKAARIAFLSGILPDPALVMTMLSENHIREELLAQSALAAALVRRATRQSGWACNDVENALAAFVDAEQQQGHDLAPYRGLLLHVQQCPECYEEYHLASEIMAAQASGILPRWPGAATRTQPATIMKSAEGVDR